MIELNTDNDGINEVTGESGIGQIQIADEVVAVIAGMAALEVEGVSAMAGNFTDIAEILGKKNLSKGVSVAVEANEVAISINLQVKFGYKIQVVAAEVQKRVKNAVETMTGLTATEINIHITGVHPDKDEQKGRMDSFE